MSEIERLCRDAYERYGRGDFDAWIELSSPASTFEVFWDRDAGEQAFAKHAAG